MARRSGPESYAKQLGERIRELRLEAEITQEKLAWSCDLQKSHLSQIESGKRLPSVTVLVDLANHLGLQPADLVGFDFSEPRLLLLDAVRRKDEQAVKQALKKLGIS